jgi:hypothetical protein
MLGGARFLTNDGESVILADFCRSVPSSAICSTLPVAVPLGCISAVHRRLAEFSNFADLHYFGDLLPATHSTATGWPIPRFAIWCRDLEVP